MKKEEEKDPPLWYTGFLTSIVTGLLARVCTGGIITGVVTSAGTGFRACTGAGRIIARVGTGPITGTATCITGWWAGVEAGFITFCISLAF